MTQTRSTEARPVGRPAGRRPARTIVPLAAALGVIASLALTGCGPSDDGGLPSTGTSGAASASPSGPGGAAGATPSASASASAATPSASASAAPLASNELSRAIKGTLAATAKQGIVVTARASQKLASGEQMKLCVTVARTPDADGKGTPGQRITISAPPQTVDLEDVCDGQQQSLEDEIWLGDRAWVSSRSSSYRAATLTDQALATQYLWGGGLTADDFAPLANGEITSKAGSVTLPVTSFDQYDAFAKLTSLESGGGFSDVTTKGTAGFSVADGRLATAQLDVALTVSGQTSTFAELISYDYATRPEIKAPTNVSPTAPATISGRDQLLALVSSSSS